MSDRLNDLLNHATPFAPSDPEDAAGRLRSSPPGTGESPGAPPQADNGRRAVPDSQRTSSLVFVPTSAPHSGTTERTGAAYELRELNEGTAGLAVYTSPDKLLQVLGAEQNYVEVEIIELLRQVAGRVPVVVDPALRSAIG